MGGPSFYMAGLAKEYFVSEECAHKVLKTGRRIYTSCTAVCAKEESRLRKVKQVQIHLLFIDCFRS